MGITRVLGSDVSADMARSTRSSLAAFVAEETVWHERIRAAGGTPNKDLSKFESQVVELDARKIKDAAKKLGTPSGSFKDISIVSEGFLGDIMSARDVTLDRVQAERKKLAAMYAEFFRGLREADFQEVLVMSFPFWSIQGSYTYFTEIYDIIAKNGFMSDSLLPADMHLNTRP